MIQTDCENDLFTSGEIISKDAAMFALHKIGGCGAQAGTWEDGWDKAITAAINEIGKLDAVTQS